MNLVKNLLSVTQWSSAGSGRESKIGSELGHSLSESVSLSVSSPLSCTMVEDETEVLDWGNEEEDQDFAETNPTLEDAEDAVSLGGDEDDEFLTYQSRVSQGTTHRTQSPSRTVYHTEKQEITAAVDARGKAPERDRPKTPSRHPQEAQTAPESTPALNRQLSFGKLTHALPPKPVVSSVPFMHPSHPSIIEATAMAARIDRDKKNGSVPKSTTYEPGDVLPPDWEVRHPRNGRGVYYYNSRTKESTWTCPGTSTSSRDRRDSRIADDTRDMAAISMTDDSLTSRIGRSDADTTLSYDDRHYRPGESARRDERPPMQSHGSQNDSFLPINRVNGERSPSPPSRHRSDVRAPPSRRQQSPPANGDRNRGRASKKDSLRPSSPIAAVDRVWVAPRDPSPVGRPAVQEGKHREAEHLPHKERERRETPRDADRMSATSTLSASSPIPIPPRRVCSSSSAGRDALKASCETSRVELRSIIFCSLLFGFFLAWTQGRSSWIPVFFFLCPPSLYLHLSSFLYFPLLFFRTQVTYQSQSRWPVSAPVTIVERFRSRAHRVIVRNQAEKSLLSSVFCSDGPTVSRYP